jgi:hypothetical protein
MIVKTFFSKKNYPSNLLTVADYRVFARSQGLRNWKTAAKRYAKSKGGAFVVRADGSLLVFTRNDAGNIRQKTFHSWGWEK